MVVECVDEKRGRTLDRHKINLEFIPVVELLEHHPTHVSQRLVTATTLAQPHHQDEHFTPWAAILHSPYKLASVRPGHRSIHQTGSQPYLFSTKSFRTWGALSRPQLMLISHRSQQHDWYGDCSGVSCGQSDQSYYQHIAVVLFEGTERRK